MGNIYGLIALVCCFLFSLNLHAQTINYTYDVLGRATFATDSVNGNRDFDYDPAGNRINMAVGITNDAASEPNSPTAPTGLVSTYSGNCYFRVSWTASQSPVSGVFYILTDTRGRTQQINTTSTTFTCTYNTSPPDVKPYSLRACNTYGCSKDVTF